uniref:Uncharacterized protein n=1 Tax=Cyprinus carpio TaxID=7962 RepID=A0A8C2AU97_CYPCA
MHLRYTSYQFAYTARLFFFFADESDSWCVLQVPLAPFGSLRSCPVWERERQEKAVKVWLSDGRIETFGNPCFTSLSLWGNRAGTRLGAIKFKTKQGGEFFAKMTSWGLKTEYPIDIGSGFCHFVIFPYTGTVKITCKNVQSTVLTDVNYPTINQIKPQVTVEEIKSVTYTNYQQQKIKTSKKLIKKIFMVDE